VISFTRHRLTLRPLRQSAGSRSRLLGHPNEERTLVAVISPAFSLWLHAYFLAPSDRLDGFSVRIPPTARSALPRRLSQFPLANPVRHRRALPAQASISRDASKRPYAMQSRCLMRADRSPTIHKSCPVLGSVYGTSTSSVERRSGRHFCGGSSRCGRHACRQAGHHHLRTIEQHICATPAEGLTGIGVQPGVWELSSSLHPIRVGGRIQRIRKAASRKLHTSLEVLT
jgi:hypothetical protein